MTPTDTAPIQAAYPVIEAERDMAIAQRDRARRDVARLREALAEIADDMVAALPGDYPWLVERMIERIDALAPAAGKAVRS